MKFINRPRPENNESLSGYIQRVAEENYITIGEIWRFFTFKKYVYNQSSISLLLDLNPYDSFAISKFCEMMMLKNIDIEQLTFISIKERLNLLTFDKYTNKNIYKLINTKRYYCPKCLLERNIYKLKWQIKDMCYCEKHLTRLCSKCPNCGNSIDLLNRYSIVGKCSYCGAYLRDKISIDYYPTEKEMLLSEVWNYLLGGSNLKVGKSNEMQISEFLALKILYLLRNHKSIPIKRKLNKIVKNDFKFIDFTISISSLINILLETNTKFDNFITQKIPEDFLWNKLKGQSKNISPYEKIINMFI